MIRAASWNQLVSRLRAAQPLSGLGVHLSLTDTGTMISANPSLRFDHPWSINARWRDGNWHFFVKPSFVNGRDVTINMSGEEVELTAEDRPYLTAAWRNPLASAGMTASMTGELITLPGEGYPAFFKHLGVRDPDFGSRGTPAFDATASERTREIRACDVVLITPRIAMRTELEFSDPATGQMVTGAKAFISDYARNAPPKYRLVAVPKWNPPREPTAMDRFLGQDVEPQTDEIKVATIWIVSPPNPPEGAAAIPDSSWVVYPQYDLFWNLAHAARNPPLSNPNEPIRVNFGGIGLGYADLIGNAMLAPINDAYDAINRFLDRSTFKGQFWTI